MPKLLCSLGMDSRQSKLLAAIIDQFIQTALPVGSKQLLSHSAEFSVLSGATIRNEMRVLGEEGFLEQPHISAGRIPTAKGYRVYVLPGLYVYHWYRADGVGHPGAPKAAAA